MNRKLQCLLILASACIMPCFGWADEDEGRVLGREGLESVATETNVSARPNAPDVFGEHHFVDLNEDDSENISLLNDEEFDPDGDLQLPDPEYHIVDIHLSGNTSTSKARILSIMGLGHTDRMTLDELENARIRLAMTGLFKNVDMRLTPGQTRSTLVLWIKVEERSRLQINDYYIGTDAKSPVWFGLNASWLAPFGMPHRFNMKFAATSKNDYTLSLGYHIPIIANIPVALSFGIENMRAREGIFGTFIHRENFADSSTVQVLKDYDYIDDMVFERHAMNIGIGYSPSSYFRIFFRTEFADISRQNRLTGIDRYLDDYLEPGTSHLWTGSFVVSYDTRSDVELPSYGHLIYASFSGTIETQVSDYQYAKISFLHQSNLKLTKDLAHIFRINTFIGIIHGHAPFFEKFFFNDFYALSPSRIERLNPSYRSGFDIFSTGAKALGYEDYLVNLSLSYAWQPIRRTFEIFGVIGAIWADSGNETMMRLGVKSGAQRGVLPIDLSFNAGVKLKTDYGLFSITLGHIFNLIPR